jgi:hypothetical protein
MPSVTTFTYDHTWEEYDYLILLTTVVSFDKHTVRTQSHIQGKGFRFPLGITRYPLQQRTGLQDGSVWAFQFILRTTWLFPVLAEATHIKFPAKVINLKNVRPGYNLTGTLPYWFSTRIPLLHGLGRIPISSFFDSLLRSQFVFYSSIRSLIVPTVHTGTGSLSITCTHHSQLNCREEFLYRSSFRSSHRRLWCVQATTGHICVHSRVRFIASLAFGITHIPSHCSQWTRRQASNSTHW